MHELADLGAGNESQETKVLCANGMQTRQERTSTVALGSDC